MGSWQYWQTTIWTGIAADADIPAWAAQFDYSVNAHFAQMASDGWELVATTPTEGAEYASYGTAGTVAHHFIWKRWRG